MTNASSIFRLSDGRHLSFAEYGDPGGKPILFCHGAPGSRWQVYPGMALTATRSGIRMIVPDRPGYGLSDPQPDRTLLDWAQDAAELMDYLGISQFGVLGYSVGGVYALACGHAMPGRVTGIIVAGSLAPDVFAPDMASGMAPSVAQTLATARDNPEALMQLCSSLASQPGALLESMSVSLPSPDKAVLANPEVVNGYLRDCEESLRNSDNGLVRDFVLATQNWGFPLETIRAAVSLWYGTEDVNAPPAMAKYLANHLPHSHLHLLMGVGHLCVFSHWETILQAP